MTICTYKKSVLKKFNFAQITEHFSIFRDYEI